MGMIANYQSTSDSELENFFGTKCPEVATCRQEWRLFSWPGHLPGEKEALCSFSHLLSTLYRPLLWPSALAWACGA